MIGSTLAVNGKFPFQLSMDDWGTVLPRRLRDPTTTLEFFVAGFFSGMTCGKTGSSSPAVLKSRSTLMIYGEYPGDPGCSRVGNQSGVRSHATVSGVPGRLPDAAAPSKYQGTPAALRLAYSSQLVKTPLLPFRYCILC